MGALPALGELEACIDGESGPDVFDNDEEVEGKCEREA
jgi:hypothetical protein